MTCRIPVGQMICFTPSVDIHTSGHTGPSESFDVNVSLYQRSVLSRLLCSVAMDIDVASSDKRSDLLSELYEN